MSNFTTKTSNLLSPLSEVAMLMVVIISGLAMIGWTFDLLIIAQVRPDFIPMAPSTALMFIMLSGAWVMGIYRPVRRSYQVLAQVITLLAVLIGSIIVIEFFTGPKFNIERWLIPSPHPFGLTMIGRMSPVTAINFILANLSLLLLIQFSTANQWVRNVVSGLAVAVFSSGLVMMIGYWYGVPLLYGSTIIPVALNTAVAFVFLGIGLVASVGPNCWATNWLVDSSIRAKLLRVFLPLIVTIILGQGWFNILVNVQLNNPSLSTSLVLIVAIIVVVIVISATAKDVGSSIERVITKRRRAEEALQESEERHRLLLEHAGLGIGYYDLTGRIVLFNQISARNMNGKPEDFIGKSMHEVFSNDIVELLQERITATVASATPLEFEDRLELPHGVFWFLSTFARIKNGAGKVIGVQVISKNLSNRKKLEAQIQRDAEVNAALANLSQALITPATHLREISDQVLAVAQSLTQSEHGYVSFIEPTTGDNVSYTLTAMIESECTLSKENQRIAFKRSPDGTYRRLWGHALNTRKGFYTNAPASHEMARGTPSGHLPLHNFLSVPALLEDTLVGQIALANSTHNYTDTDLKVIEQIAVIYASALQRKRIETEFLNEKQFADDIINSLPGIFYLLDESGRLVRWNPRLLEVLGYSPEEIVKPSALEFFNESDRPMVAKQIQQAFQEGESFIEVSLLNNHGQTIPYQLTGRRTQIKGCTYLVWLGEDITERQRAEEELREARDFAEQVIETANVMVIGLNMHGQIVIYNSAAEAITGYSRTEVSGQNWFELIVPRQRYPHVWEAFKQLNNQQRIYSFENPILTKSGEERFISWRNSMLHQNGQIIGTISFGMDITERKQTEAEREQYFKFFQFASDLMCVAHPNYYFSRVNPAFVNTLGYTEAELCSRSYLDFVHPEDLEKTRGDREVAFSPNGTINFDNRYLSKEGKVVWLSWSAKLSPEEKVVYAIARNITERKQMELDLQRAKDAADAANRAKSTFLANMSHELRTPLNGILGYAQILRRDPQLTSKQQEGIQIIKQCGDYLLTLLNDVLDLAKIEAGKIELSPTIVFLEKLLQEVVQLFQIRAQQKEIRFTYQPLSKLPVAIQADEKRLRQVLINLLGNAIKFTDRGGITLTAIYEEDTLRFQVEDTGTGIATADLEKIFLPFQQVGDKKYQEQGSGLGLPITKTLVEMMGGQLQVTSTLGKGSIFEMSLQLPRVAALPSPRDSPLQKIIGYQGQRRTVLVIDDQPINRSLLINMLTPLGFTVLEAAGGQAGLDQARERVPLDVILIDLVMPDLNGFTVIQQLRQLPHCQNTILIAVSASAFESDRQKSIAMGGNDFIPKPINLELLLDRLGVHLNLTWCYAAANTPMVERTLPQQVPSFELNPEQAKELFHLTQCGDVGGVSDYVQQLSTTNEKLADFANYVLKLAQRFDLDEIGDLVEPYLHKVGG